MILAVTLVLPSSAENSRRVPRQWIALTFDDGPTLGITDKILEILKKQKVKATFFVIGRKVEQNPHILSQIARDGHAIGNHTYYHTRTTWINNEKLLKEITRTSEMISAIAGTSVSLFRPPHGKITNQKIKFLEKQGYNIVLWSVNGDDYYREDRGMRSPASIIRRVVSRVRGRDIVLLHDNSRQMVEALPGMIRQLKRKGFVFVKVSEINHYQKKKNVFLRAQTK